MDTLEFLRRILPTTGIYCSFRSQGKRKGSNRYHDSIEELARAVQAADADGQDAYFALSTFKESGSRHKVNAQANRVIVIDIDCGPDKPYATWKDGLRALHEFIQALVLPKPTIVRSGNGLHVYWTLSSTPTLADRTILAKAMRAACADKGLEIDAGCTTDLARVLRPVGTHNYKNPQNPRPVTVKLLGDDVAYSDLMSALSYYAQPVTQTSRSQRLLDSLKADTEFPPTYGVLIAEKCQQIRWITNNQGDVEEPLWRLALGVAAYCENSQRVAVAWSDKHPQYSESETLGKMERWKAGATGPTTCAAFELQRPSGCKGCSFAGKISSPAKLGERRKEIAVAVDAPRGAITGVALPKAYKRTDSGIVLKVDGTEVPVTDFDVYPIGYGYDEHLGYEVAQFTWKRPHAGWSVLKVRQAHLTETMSREFTVSAADQGILLASKKSSEDFQFMLRAYMAELRRMQAATNIYTSMGWKENDSAFVIGDEVYRRKDDGTVDMLRVPLASNTGKAGVGMFSTAGTFEKWQKGVAALEKADMQPHLFCVLIGLSAPLVHFSGLKGVLYSLYGPTGSGKSLGQLILQSVSGDPQQLHQQSQFTMNALYNRCGLFSNLAVTVDEATQLSPAQLGEICYNISQGQDKARLTKMVEEREARTWALPLVVSTNVPVASKVASLGLQEDAQLARLIELRVDKHRLLGDDTTAGRAIYQTFTRNYGHAIRTFVEHLVALGPERVSEMVEQATVDFPKVYGRKFTGQERYWEMGFVAPHLAGEIASSLGIIDFDYRKAVLSQLQQIKDMREAIESSRLDVFDLLSEYMNQHVNEMVTVFYPEGRKPYHGLDSLPRGPIRARVNAYQKRGEMTISNGAVLFDKTHLRRWFAKQGYDPKELFNRVKEAGYDATPTSGKASLGKDTPIRIPQCYVFGVSLRHPRLRGIMDDARQTHEELVFAELRVVDQSP